jgi:hypothetical protein
MTVNEMHIAVNQGVQKIASFQVDNLLPQEIDHELNLAMMRFIKQRFNYTSNQKGKGFEQSQKRIDDLRSLLVEHTGETFYEGRVYTSNYSNVYVDRYTLPLDYLFLVSVRTDVKYKCNVDINSLISFTYNQRSAVKVDLTPPQPGYVLTGLERWNQAAGNWEGIVNLPLGETITNDLLLDSGNYYFGIRPSISFPEGTYGATVQQSPQLDSNHINLINTVWDGTVWGSGSTVSVRATWILPGDMTTAYVVPHSITQTITKRTRLCSACNNRISLASFGQHDDILYMMDDPFNMSWYHEPTYTIEENYIDVYTDNQFVVPNVKIKYIRKPAEISYTHGIGCELAVHTHHEIVEMTVKSILEGIQDPRYQTQTMETFESE